VVAGAPAVSAEGQPGPRPQARQLVEALAAAEPRLVALGGVDLAGALEQQLFFALRDGEKPPRRARLPIVEVAATARLSVASAIPLGRWQLPRVEGAPAVILVRDPTHYPVIGRLAEIFRDSSLETVVVRTGRATESPAPLGLIAPRLERFVDPPLVPGLWAHEAWLLGRRAAIGAAWAPLVDDRTAAMAVRAMRRELPRIALGAAALSGVVRHHRPSLLVAFDEIGTWARLLPAVGLRHGVPTLDLPHAEASDPIAIHGAGYDRMAVYGRRASAVLRDAGVASERIVEIGAPRFDPLVAAARNPRPPTETRRVVYAAQYAAGAMTHELLDVCHEAAAAIAQAAAPAELVLVPHPADPAPRAVRSAAERMGAQVSIRLADGDALHQELIGAWAMVTGWSNSVLEAAIAGVPSIAVAPTGRAPVDWAADGLAQAATDPESAAEAARGLLDPAHHLAAVERARAALGDRIGVLDGLATERAARLALDMARGGWRADARMARA
jgi:hypothetical protein